MGDRGNVYVVQHPGGGDEAAGGLYLYTHWAGRELPLLLQAALARGEEQWEDEAYLARIIFAELARGAELETTGLGTTTYLTDNEWPLLVVDTEAGTVGLAVPGQQPQVHAAWTFAEFVGLALPAGAPWTPLEEAAAAAGRDTPLPEASDDAR